LFGKRKDEDSVGGDEAGKPEYDDPGDAPVSPLAMMSEKSPEAWLGQFLTIVGAPPALQFSTIKAAKQDERLAEHLRGVLEKAGKEEPMRLLEPGFEATLKEQDWGAWWKASETLGRYCYSALSLAMLGDEAHNGDVVAMYRQEANSRIKRDANYVICYVLGKDWPGYQVTEADLAKLVQ
jgi:hypothetical protein